MASLVEMYAENPDFAVARAEVDRAVREWTRQRLEILRRADADEWGEIGAGDPYVTGWVVSLEYTNQWMEQNAKTGTTQIVPPEQTYSTSLGLLTIAQRDF